MSEKKMTSCTKLSYFRELSEWFAIFRIVVYVSVLFRRDRPALCRAKKQKIVISRRLIQWVMNEVRAGKKRERLLLSLSLSLSWFSGSIGWDNSFAHCGICRSKKSSVSS